MKLLAVVAVFGVAGCVAPQPTLSVAPVPLCRGCVPAYPEHAPDERTLADRQLCQAEPPGLGCLPQPPVVKTEERQAEHALCRPRPEGMRQIDDLKGALEVVIQTWDHDSLGAFDMPRAIEYARRMLQRADWEQRPDL